MVISSFLAKLLYNLPEKNYDATFSLYRLWIEICAAHGGIPNDKLCNGILTSPRPEWILATYHDVVAQGNERPDWVNPFAGHPISYNLVPEEEFNFSGNLIHDGIHLLLRFITDVEQDPVLSKYAISLRDQLCRNSLKEFFEQNLSYLPGGGSYAISRNVCHFYIKVNLVAHWVNLGFAQLEDVRDHILQSLTSQPTVHPHQLNALMILLKISGATFAAYVDPSIMDRCCDLLKTGEHGGKVADKLANVRALSLETWMIYESLDYRRFYNFGRTVGGVSLLLRSSAARHPKPPLPNPKTPRRLRSRRLLDSRGLWNSLGHPPFPLSL